MLCLESLGKRSVSSVPGIGTAYSINAAASLVFHAGGHKPGSKRNCFAAHAVNEGCPAFTCLTRPLCRGLCFCVHCSWSQVEFASAGTFGCNIRLAVRFYHMK